MYKFNFATFGWPKLSSPLFLGNNVLSRKTVFIFVEPLLAWPGCNFRSQHHVWIVSLLCSKRFLLWFSTHPKPSPRFDLNGPFTNSSQSLFQSESKCKIAMIRARQSKLWSVIRPFTRKGAFWLCVNDIAVTLPCQKNATKVCLRTSQKKFQHWEKLSLIHIWRCRRS